MGLFIAGVIVGLFLGIPAIIIVSACIGGSRWAQTHEET